MSTLCQMTLAYLRVRAGIARACARHHTRRDACQLSDRIVAVPIRAPLCWCECVLDLVRPRLCERLSSPFFRSAVNCNQIKAANHLGPLKRAYVP